MSLSTSSPVSLCSEAETGQKDSEVSFFLYTTRHPKTALAYKQEESAYLQFVAKVKSINLLQLEKKNVLRNAGLHPPL